MRTTGALLAAAAVVLLVLGPVMQRRALTPPPSTSLEEPTSTPEDDALVLEQWAMADPLADALDQSEMDLEEAGSDEALDAELDDFFSYPNPGDSL